MHQVIVLLGPTASGKSALGVHLAKKFQGIIISADSRQVYRGLDLGTGKITKREMTGVPHYLLDVASPRGQYSVSRYAADVRRVIKQTPLPTPIFLVGGSPFYIDAVTKPGSFSTVPPNPKLRRRLANMTTATLVKLLKEKDAARAKTIDPANRRRLIRAIEIASVKSIPTAVEMPPMRVLKIGLRPAKKLLETRIKKRLLERLRQGMVAEVAALHRTGLAWARLDSFGLEYRFISRYLQEQLTKAEMTAQLNTAIKHFAKRQMTWWKRDREIHWVTTPDQAERLTRARPKI